MAEARGGYLTKAKLEKIREQIESNMQMKVGIPRNATYPDGTYVATVAAQNEYGAVITVPAHESKIYRVLGKNGELNKSGKFVKKKYSNFETTVEIPEYTIVIPSRPAWRQTFEKYKDEWSKNFAGFIKATNYDLEKAFNRLGIVASGNLSKAILDFDDPPNAPKTIKRKGFDNPLVNKGILYRSITYEVMK